MSDTKPVFDDTTIGLLIDPLDPLFFRDGRPFEAASRGVSGLPMPRTLYGMLRYHLFEQAGLKRNEIHTLRQKQDHPLHWLSWIAVRGPWLAKPSKKSGKLDVFVAPPAHVMQVGKKGEEYVALRPLPNDVSLPGWHMPTPYDGPPLRPLWAGRFREDLKPISGKLLRPEGLKLVLNDGDDLTNEHLIRQSELWQHEERVGVGIDAGKQTAKEGLLYTTSMLRLENNVVFYAEVGIERDMKEYGQKLQELLGDGFTAPFGGEGRRVRVQVMKEKYNWPKVEGTPVEGQAGFFAMQISPTVLCPSKHHGSPEEERMGRWAPPNQLGSLIAAAIPRSIPESGWELLGIQDDNGFRGRAAGMPRPTRYAIPAGATTFWQSGNGAPKEVLHRWQLGQTPLDRAAGYGTALRGVWKWWGS
jgi:CRISPR-associated protein Cmr3